MQQYRATPTFNAGFTLVELVMVVIIVAIIGVYTAPKLFGKPDYAAVVYQNRAISILRNMQTRAMQDTRSRAPNVGEPPLAYCYQVNITTYSVSIPSNDFITTDNPGSDSGIEAQNRAEVEATCNGYNWMSDAEDPGGIYHVDIDDGFTLSATASRQLESQAERPAINTIRFDKSGRAVGISYNLLGNPSYHDCTGSDEPRGCQITFNGDSNATVCVETEGYIYACG